MIINKQVGGVYLIDPTILDPTTRIVSVLSLDCVATSKINTQVPSVILFKDTSGRPTASVAFDTSLQHQDEGGTPTNWTGTIDELLQKLNNEYFVQPIGGGGGSNVVVTNNPDPSTATNQTAGNDLLLNIEDLAKVKEDAYFFNTDDVAIEANKIVFPITCTISVVSPPNLIEGVSVATYANMDALVIGFNAGITYYQIAKRSEDSFYVLDGSLVVSENKATGIISFNNAGLPAVPRQYFFTALNVGALSSKGVDGISSNDAILSYLRQVNQPTPLRLLNPSDVTFTGFKYLVFSCDGANNSITVTQNGSSVTYPKPNLDGSLLRGYELPLSKVPYTNSITFNGMGTVDILKID